jgi:hypothetical protein
MLLGKPLPDGRGSAAPNQRYCYRAATVRERSLSIRIRGRGASQIDRYYFVIQDARDSQAYHSVRFCDFRMRSAHQ